MTQLAFLWIHKPIDPEEDPEIGEEAERLAKKVLEIAFKIYGPVPSTNNPFFKAVKGVSEKKELLTLARNKKSSVSQRMLSAFWAFSGELLSVPMPCGNIEFSLSATAQKRE